MSVTKTPSEFSIVLRTLLDGTKILSRAEWARVLGVSESAISQWVNDSTFPSPENLRNIFDTLMHDSRVKDELLEEFESIAAKPLQDVSPRAASVSASTINEYLVQPLRERFAKALAALPAWMQENVLRDATERSWMLRERESAQPSVQERRHGGFRALVASELSDAEKAAKAGHETKARRAEQESSVAAAELVAAIRKEYELQGSYVQDLISAGFLSESRPRRRQEIDLGAVVGQAVEAIQAAVESRGLQVHKAIGRGLDKIAGDAESLHHAFGSLVLNAASVASPGERIDVLVKSEQGVVVVEIKDKLSGYASLTGRVHDKGHLGRDLLLTSRIIRLSGGRLSTGARTEECVFRATFPSRRPGKR